MNSETLVSMYCPDCRGRFEIGAFDIEEDEVLECALCAAEILVVQKNPIRVKLYTEADDF